MDPNNPYGSPNAPVLAQPPQLSSSAPVGPAVIDQLCRTGPWVRCFSVVTFIGAGFSGLAAVAFLFMGGLVGAVAQPGSNGPQGTAAMLGISMFYGVLAGLYIYPAIKLWKYASGISALAATRQEADLVRALDQQRALWKYACLALIALIVLGFAAALVSPLLVGASK